MDFVSKNVEIEIKYIQENYRNRNKPVGGKRSMERMEREADDCKGKNMKKKRNYETLRPR